MATRKKTVIAIDETERCANCKHFGLDEGVQVCKRYPRQFMLDGEDTSMCYPPHNPDDVCGEFKRKLQG